MKWTFLCHSSPNQRRRSVATSIICNKDIFPTVNFLLPLEAFLSFSLFFDLSTSCSLRPVTQTNPLNKNSAILNRKIIDENDRICNRVLSLGDENHQVFAWVFRSTVEIHRRAKLNSMLSCDIAYPYNFYCRLSIVAEVEIASYRLQF